MEFDSTKLCKFSANTEEGFEKISDTISKCRCRIFYKGANRNGTYITDEFAEKLISTLPYTPVKGIFDSDSDDFTDHGKSRNLGRIYGVVPAENNFAWETHMDEDGIERTYACTDVYIYTALYSEANAIPGKAQSMELYYKTIKGDWKVIEGKRYYVYEDASFLGLQALGTEVEPCFEGAQFFALYKSLKTLTEEMEKYNFQQEEPKMINFKLSDDQKFRALWSLLNVNYNEENDWIVEYDICEVFDEYAIVHNYETGEFERVYYIKNDEVDSVEIVDRKRCYIIDVDEEEKETLDYLRKRNCHTLDAITNHFTAYENLEQENLQNCTKIEECNATIATLSTERDNANANAENISNTLNSVNAEFSACKETLASITAERDALASFKKDTETAEKMNVVNNYIDSLSEEIIEKYTNNLDNYTLEELDMNLTYEQKKAHPETFSAKPVNAFVPKDEPKSGINTILDKFERH